MTWIKTLRLEDDERVRELVLKQRQLYPIEYSTPAPSVDRGFENSIVCSHTLFPEVLFHSFSAFGAIMSPNLPLQRYHHALIASWFNYISRVADALGVGRDIPTETR